MSIAAVVTRLPVRRASPLWTEAADAATAAAVLPSVLARLGARTVLQYGCGNAVWLGASLTAGVDDVLGVDDQPGTAERAWIPRDRIVERPLDGALDLERRFDLALAPDLGSRPPGSCDAVIDALVRHADAILIGLAAAADPGDRVWLHALTALDYLPVDGLPDTLATDPAIAPWHRRGLFLVASAAARARHGLTVATTERSVPTTTAEVTWRPPGPLRSPLAARARVAVVIPCHNYARFLPDAVASVATQTWPLIECIVVDDGSTDDTAAVAAELVARHPDLDLRLVRQRNQGVAQARNRGVRAAVAPLVMQLDADDRLEPDAVARLVAALRADPTADVAHCDAREFGTGDAPLPAAPRVSLARLRRGNCMNYCALVRRAFFLGLGGYRDIRGGYDDWDLWLSAAEAGARFAHVEAPLLRYRRHGRSLLDRERARADVLRAQVVWNHPMTFAPRELRLATEVLAGAAGEAGPALGLRLRLALDALLAGRVKRAWRHVARV